MDYNIKRLSDYSDESLLNELKRVAKQLDKTPTQHEFNLLSRTNHSTIVNRFGSWNAALKKAGLPIQRAINISDEELFNEIQNTDANQCRTIAEFGKSNVFYQIN